MTVRRTHARRRATLLTAVAAGALALTGCTVTNPTATMIDYAPADGIELDGESVDVRDLLIVSHGNGAPGVVTGSLINTGSEPVTVVVNVAGQPLSPEITVEPDSTARLDGVQPDGTEGQAVQVPALETPAGQSVEVRVETGEETLAGRVPVLLPQGVYEQYADDAGGTVEPAPEDGSGG